MKLLKKIVSTLLVICMAVPVLSAFACGGGGGGELKFTSMTVSTSGVTTEYFLNDTVDFSNVTASVKYSDSDYNKTLSSSQLTFVYPTGFTADTITSVAGKKEIKVYFTDTTLGDAVDRYASFTINVVNDNEVAGTTYYVEGYSAPASYIAYKNLVANAGTANYGDELFEGQFFAGDDVDKSYYVGSQNDFKFVPMITVSTEEFGEVTQDFNAFSSDIKIWVKDGGEYVELTPTVDGKVANYANYVTVNTYTHAYDFATLANGKEFKISVAPDNAYYMDINTEDAVAPIVFEVKVIDAFNVYTANELSAFDNDAGNDHIQLDAITGNWDNFKAEKNIGTAENGIVLHNNITVTSSSLPSSYYWTKQGGYTYAAGTQNQITMYDYLFDTTSIYRRILTTNVPFNFVGNYFTLDAEQLPVIASPDVYGPGDTSETYNYGTGAVRNKDYSNSELFDVQIMSDNAQINVFNVNFKGNAHISELKDNAENADNPVYAGGVIFMRTIREDTDTQTQFGSINLNNVILKTFFIGLKPEIGTTLNVNKVKLFDSCYNAIFAISRSVTNITNSYIQRAGGPLIMMQYNEDDDYNASTEPQYYYEIPVVNASNSVLESYVKGDELWFKTLHADEYFEDIKGFNPVFNMLGKSFLSLEENRANKMNFVALNMANGTSPAELIGKVETQGKFTYNYADGKSIVLDKIFTGSGFGDEVLSKTIEIAMAYSGVTALNVAGSNQLGTLRAIMPTDANGVPTAGIPASANFFNGATPINPFADQAIGILSQSDYCVFYLGGFSILTQLFPVA